MANPTTNYGFVLPTSSDLVTDLPADFDVALQGVDTRLKALQPGTTLGDLAYSSATANTNTRLPIGTAGQVLTVVGGVPAWSSETGDISAVTAGTGISGGGTSGAVTITNDMATTITTNGDLIYGTGSGTYTRRGIGTTGQILTVSGGVPTWASPAGGGKILQVVMGTTSTQTRSTTSTFTDTGLTATITPSATTSKVLVMVHHNGVSKSFNNTRGNLQLLRNSTNIITFSGYAGETGNTNTNNPGTVSTSYLDSPATTSAITYKTQQNSDANNSAFDTQTNNSCTSTIILMEVGA